MTNVEASSHPLQQDELWIESVLSGDQQSFHNLVQRYEPRVAGVVRRYLDNSEDVRDAIQTTWMKAWANLNNFRRQSCFSTWVTRIAINEALQICRQTSRRRLVNCEEIDSLPLSRLPKSSGANLEPFLVNLMRDLPKRYGHALYLHSVYGMTDGEIAHREAISISAAKSRLHRARRMIRQVWLSKAGQN